MSDNDSDGDDRDGLNLTGFLFGNLDEKGELENDFLDEEAKRHLGSLSRFGLNSLLNDVINEETDIYSDNSSSSDDRRHSNRGEDHDDDTDFSQKVEGAIDYSDINELADESPSRYDDMDLEEAIPANKLGVDRFRDDDGTDDKELMPPPPPLKLHIPDQKEISELNGNQTPSTGGEKRFDTPLAAMLPSKYADTDVRELFPDFSQDKVLRFSRLFGPAKISSRPQIWRSVRRRRKKERQRERGLKYKEGSDSTSDTDEPVNDRGFSLNFAPIPSKDQWASDDEDRLLSAVNEADKEDRSEKMLAEAKPAVADWRYGPAQIWYDMLEVPDTGEGFNYGFKMKENPEPEEETENPIPDDAYLMVSQLHWEDEVVWDGAEIKHRVLQKLNSKTNAAGWLPSSGSRTAGAFSQPGKSVPPTPTALPSTKVTGKKSAVLLPKEEMDDTWYSIFPVENEELVYGKWEDEVIWDAEAMTKIPKPKVLTLDPNDENIILGIPDDIDPSTIIRNSGPQPKVKIPHPHVKKSKILLGKAGVINVLAEDTPPPPPKSPDRDPFNISNDVYYMAKSSEAVLRLKVGGASLIQHSTPVVELRAPFIPTHMGPNKLRNFHRTGLKRFSHGALVSSAFQPTLPLLKHIKKKASVRNAERIASGGGDVFFMRTPEDLTGKDGEIVLVEFCEEHPPLMNQVGMCSKIKTYYKRKAAKDSGPPEFKYGEVAVAHTSPFLGILHPGQSMQVVENNMYRAPIYHHNVPSTDFLIIRTRQNYFIREIDALFVAGQECPLYEVPGPNSKKANNFTRDFLQVFIYRLFWGSKDNPRKIKMDDIKKAFPAHSESSIRKRLKQCADFKRTGMDSNYWVIKPEFRLPSEEEIRAMVSPEQCCAYFSMIAAEQRLKDAGYGEKFMFAQQEDDDEEQQLKMDDELKVAPWNTTRAYIHAVKGKCILQLTGPADPTGCGEGFSYVRMPNKPTQNKEEVESQPKRTVTGTDADLRRLSLNNAKALLRKFQVPEEEIKKLSRWEVIDVVRTLSTEKAKAGEEGMDKFSRGNRFSIAEHQERYKEECQRIFDLQNKVLASNEVLSTDEGDESTASEEDQSDLEELGKNLENMLSNKKTSTQLSLEREEQERQELLRKIMEEREGGKPKGKKEEDQGPQQPTSKILRITRVFKNAEGKEYTRVETVRRLPVIDAYTKIRTTKDEAFIKQFATLDEAQKEEMKREKRRLQEQLRRIKRNQEKIGMQQNQHHPTSSLSIGTQLGGPSKMIETNPFPNQPSSSSSSLMRDQHSPKNKKIKMKPDLKLKCGACGQVGHMRTNKACPQYTGTIPTPSVNVALTEEQEEEIEKELADEEDDLVNVDGTKLKLSGKVLKRREELQRRTLKLKVPKGVMGHKRRRMGSGDTDYLQRNKTANRRRTDPVVLLSTILEQILNEIRDLPDVQPFLLPVKEKHVADYYTIIQRPMDLQTIRENLRHKKYQSRSEFLADVNQIVDNSVLYNGQNHTYTQAAQRMLQRCVDRLADKQSEERLIRLEKVINPLLDDNDQVSLSFIFEKVINGKLKTTQESWPFLKPVDRKKVKDYYTVIRRPMDLETILKKIKSQKYHNHVDFLADIELIVQNSEQYNGPEHTLTLQARTLHIMAQQAIAELSNHIDSLEANILVAQEKARNEAENDQSWAEYEHDGDDDGDNFDPDAFEFNKPGPPIIAPKPEVKRSRGRPRKQPVPQPEGEQPVQVKRGRGRPRKDSMNVSSQNSNSYLEEDLQFSTDDEEFEEVENTEEMVVTTLVQGEQSQMMAGTSMDHSQSFHMGGPGEDDSHSAAEAMVQLSGIGFYNQSSQGGDESMDIDPNYDPSDFLSMGNRMPSAQPQAQNQGHFVMPPPPVQQQQNPPHYDQHEFTAPIEYKYDPHAMQFTPIHEPSYEYKPNFGQNIQQTQAMQMHNIQQTFEQMAEEATQEVIAPQYEEHQNIMYQAPQLQQQQYQPHQPMYMDAMPAMSNVKMEPQPVQQERPLHDDLDISDSDDESGGQGAMKMDMFKQEQPQDPDDGEGLWF